MRDKRLVLEAAPGGASLPADCFASVRFDDAAASSLKRCKANEANHFGDLPEAGAVASVDLFKYVGTISIGLREPGATVEATVPWPGLKDGEVLTLRLTLGGRKEPPVLTDVPSMAVAPSLETPKQRWPITLEEQPEVIPTTPDVGLARSNSAPEPPNAKPVSSISARTPAQTICPQVEEREEKSYRPIVLNNCNQIIPNLYLGGVDAASDTEQLVQQGIRAVCCCVRELEFPTSEFNKKLDYFRVDVEDISREPIELFFPEATEFIHSWISREQPVLVHCRAGVSRSGSVVIAYLIKYGGYSLHDAFFLARSHRPIVTPNLGFMEKLGEFESQERGTDPTIDLNKYVAWYSHIDRAAVPDLKPD